MAPADALGGQRPSNASGTRNILGFQSDIYQRYAFLTRLLDEVCSPGAPQAAAPAIRILDIGSGPMRLTEAFLPSDVEIVRADVEQFGDDSIVQIQPRQPLPFADDVFDVVLALDVLEHVPCDERALLMHECQRVARRVVILASARAISGRDVDFLVEHATLGLPERAAVEEALRSPGWHVMSADNSPLGEWLLYNLADLVYACDLGDGPAKQGLNREFNRRACFLRPGQTHYRTFFCGFRDIADAKAAERYVERERARCAVLTPVEIAGVTTEALLWLRRDLPHRFVTELAANEAAVEGVLVERDAHIATLNAEASNLREALVEKDAHIATLDQRLAALRADVDRFEGEAAQAQGALTEREWRIVERDQADRHPRYAGLGVPDIHHARAGSGEGPGR
jgi:hypothetical protein